MDKPTIDLTGWMPIRFYWQENAPVIDWIYLDGTRFIEPFFEQTIDGMMMQTPFNRLFRHQTSVDILLDWQSRRPGVKPSGFIFHLSRCGSTLITQMLATSDQHVVLSEPGPVDSVLHAHLRNPAVSNSERMTWAQAMVSAMMPAQDSGLKGFIKFDSWHTAHLPLLKTAFPDVPMIFLYREPIEVLISQLARRGSQTIPGYYTATALGLDLMTAMQLSAEEYCSRILQKTCECVLADNTADSMLLINYTQLPEFVFKKILPFFGVTLSDTEIEQMKRSTTRDAKDPHFSFSPDSARKQSEATPELRAIIDRLVTPLYAELESIRLKQQ